MRKVDLRHELDTLDEYWSQRVVGEANGSLIKVAKGIGEVGWHQHDDQDEVFLVMRGAVTVQFRDMSVDLTEGQMIVVPRGVPHRPRADEEAQLVVLGVNVTSNRAGGKPEWSYRGAAGAPPGMSDD